jgi:hypothetical protein
MNENDIQFCRWLLSMGKIHREILAVETLLYLITSEEEFKYLPVTTAKHLKTIKELIETMLKRIEL